MLRFVVRRLLQLIPILFGLSILLFAWLRLLPGGPATALLGERATPERIAAINRAYGLDQPIWVQYWSYLTRIVRFDLGDSIQNGRPVTDVLRTQFPGTIELTIAALIFAVGVGVPLGYFAARRQTLLTSVRDTAKPFASSIEFAESKLDPMTFGMATGFGPFETLRRTRESCATDAPTVGDCETTSPCGLSDSTGMVFHLRLAAWSAVSASSSCLPTTSGTWVFGGPLET